MANSLKHFLVFMLGFFAGAVLAVVYLDLSFQPRIVRVSKSTPAVSDKVLYEFAFRKSGLTRRSLDPDEISFGSDKKYLTEAQYLYSNISLICVVFVQTGSSEHAYHVTNTWGKRCNRLIFFGEKSNHFLDVKRVKSVHSWQYLCEAVRHIWSKYGGELQWVLFSPDHVFVLPENLRFVLAPKNCMKPYYIGHKVIFWNQIFNAASAGYVLSYKAIELLMKKFSDKCASTGKYFNNEDYYLGMHLEEVGVKATDAIDDEGRQRFHLFNPTQLLSPGSFSVLQKYSKRSLAPVVQGYGCCSPTTISFQATAKDSAYLYDYLLYNVNIFHSGNKGNNQSAVYTPMDQVWKKFISDEFGDLDPKLVSNEDYYKMWTLKVESPDQFNEKLKKLFESHT